MSDKGEIENPGYTMDKVQAIGQSYSSGRIKRLALSPRELELLAWVSHGHTTHQISELLYISPETVETHRKNIMRKLQANNMIAAVASALRSNLIK